MSPADAAQGMPASTRRRTTAQSRPEGPASGHAFATAFLDHMATALPEPLRRHLDRLGLTCRAVLTMSRNGAVSHVGQPQAGELAAWVRAATGRRGRSLEPEQVGRLLEAMRSQQPLVLRVDLGLDALPRRWREVLAARLADPPRSLEDVGQSFGITRERVRQLEGYALRIVGQDGTLAAELDQRLAKLRARRTAELTLDELAAASWFHGIDSRPGLLSRLLELLACYHRVFAVQDDTAIVTLAAGEPKDLVAACCRRLDALPRQLQGRHPRVLQELRRELRERGVPELEPLVTAATGELTRSRRGFGKAISTPERIEDALRAHGGEMTIEALVTALRREVPAITERNLRAAIERADVVCSGLSRYVLRELLRHHDRLLPRVREDAIELMRCEPWRQWRCDDLLAALAEAGAAWAQTLPAHALDHLLRQLPEAARLGRGYFALREAGHAARRQIRDVAEEILREQGKPLPYEQLFAAIAEERSIGVNFNIRFPLVRLPAGIGLAPRDLGLQPAEFEQLVAAVRARLSSQRVVTRSELQALERELRPGAVAVPVAVLFSLLVQEPGIRLAPGQTGLARRVRKQP